MRLFFDGGVRFSDLTGSDTVDIDLKMLQSTSSEKAIELERLLSGERQLRPLMATSGFVEITAWLGERTRADRIRHVAQMFRRIAKVTWSTTFIPTCSATPWADLRLRIEPG
jgi:hypothetical protein